MRVLVERENGSFHSEGAVAFTGMDVAVVVVDDVGILFSRNRRIPVTFFRVLNKRDRVSGIATTEDTARRDPYLPPDQLWYDRIDVLDGKQRDPLLTLYSSGGSDTRVLEQQKRSRVCSSPCDNVPHTFLLECLSIDEEVR